MGNYLLKIRKKTDTIVLNTIEFSICVFKLESLPSFIDEEITPRWKANFGNSVCNARGFLRGKDLLKSIKNRNDTSSTFDIDAQSAAV